MHEFLTPYHTTLTASALLALAVLLQAIVSLGYRHKHKDTTGHMAGTPLAVDHTSLIFRLTRSFENSLENLPAFALSITVAIALAVEPFWVNLAAVVFVAARLGHWAAYAAGQQSLRSGCFALGLLTNLILAVAVLLVAIL